MSAKKKKPSSKITKTTQSKESSGNVGADMKSKSKKGTGKAKGKSKSESAAAMSDPRFEHISSDKRFKPIPKIKKTVKIDDRFKDMFTSESFKTKFLTEGESNESNEELKRLYHTEEDERIELEQDSKGPGKNIKDLHHARFAVDYSRGEQLLESSDESENEQVEEDEDGFIDVYANGDVDGYEEVPVGDETRRLAICNLTWEKVTAGDLFVLANSFKPATGVIESVAIYLSDFGKERLAEEERCGPAEFLSNGSGKSGEELDENEDSGHEDEEISQKNLRMYELSKLKYYYAVVECDTVDTCKAIYDACDGVEFEKSQNILDIRFIPDDVTFDDEPKEKLTELPAEIDFKLGKLGQNPLAHSNLKVTWDQDDEDERVLLKKRKFSQNELEKMDFSAYMASDSEESDFDDDVAGRTAKMKALLDEIKDVEEADEPDGDMEVTWSVGLKEKASELVQARKDALEERKMTLGEKQEKKRILKKKARKEKIKELKKAGKTQQEDESSDEERNELRVGGDDAFFKQDFGEEFKTQSRVDKPNSKKKKQDYVEETKDILSSIVADEDEKHFDMNRVIKNHKNANKKGKRKRSKQPEFFDSFKLNTQDARFGAVFEDKNYSIDPTMPEFKKTREMERLIAERQTRVSKSSKR